MDQNHLFSSLAATSRGLTEGKFAVDKGKLIARAKKWLGKVVIPKGGRRRYVVSKAHAYGLGGSFNGGKGAMSFTLTALSGSLKGSHDSNHGEDNIASRWQIDPKSQSIEFEGKEAPKLRSMYLRDARIPWEQGETDAGAYAYIGASAVGATTSPQIVAGPYSGMESVEGDLAEFIAERGDMAASVHRHLTEARGDQEEAQEPDFKRAASKLLQRSTDTTEKGLGYRAYLRAVQNGKPSGHLPKLSGPKGEGAAKARDDLIDLAGKNEAREPDPKPVAKSGSELDVVHGRGGPGARKDAKKAMNKRFRKQGKDFARQAMDEGSARDMLNLIKSFNNVSDPKRTGNGWEFKATKFAADGILKAAQQKDAGRRDWKLSSLGGDRWSLNWRVLGEAGEHDVVYYWSGGTDKGSWHAATPEPSVDAQIKKIEKQGRVAVPGKKSIGPPSGPPSRAQFKAVGFLGEAVKNFLPGVSVDKQKRGNETMWLLKKGSRPIGYVTQFDRTRTETHPHKAFQILRYPVRSKGDAKYLGATYRGGLKKAAEAVVSGRALKESIDEKIDKKAEIEVELRKAGSGHSAVRAVGFYQGGQKVDVYQSFSGSDEDEVMKRIRGFYPKAKIKESRGVKGVKSEAVAKGPIDWKAVEQRARGMSSDQLHGALLDIQKTLASADALDREDNGDRGGYYRDEASIYRKEQQRRTRMKMKSQEVPDMKAAEALLKQKREQGAVDPKVTSRSGKIVATWRESTTWQEAAKEKLMEPGFVRTADDEKKWDKAKDIAQKQGADEPYALANHIFHKMKGESVEEASYPGQSANTAKMEALLRVMGLKNIEVTTSSDGGLVFMGHSKEIDTFLKGLKKSKMSAHWGPPGRRIPLARKGKGGEDREMISWPLSSIGKQESKESDMKEAALKRDDAPSYDSTGIGDDQGWMTKAKKKIEATLKRDNPSEYTDTGIGDAQGWLGKAKHAMSEKKQVKEIGPAIAGAARVAGAVLKSPVGRAAVAGAAKHVAGKVAQKMSGGGQESVDEDTGYGHLNPFTAKHVNAMSKAKKGNVRSGGWQVDVDQPEPGKFHVSLNKKGGEYKSHGPAGADEIAKWLNKTIRGKDESVTESEAQFQGKKGPGPRPVGERIEALRDIVEAGEAGVVDGQEVDPFIARKILEVHDGVRPDLAERFAEYPVADMAAMAFEAND